MRDNETMCAHDDAGPYHQHTLIKEKKRKDVHLRITFLIMDNLGYKD